MPLRKLDRTPSGWGSGVGGVRHIKCECEPDSMRISCEVYPEEPEGKPATLTGIEVELRNAEETHFHGRTFTGHFDKDVVCWVDSGVIECEGEKVISGQKYRKIQYETIDPKILLSTTNAEKVREWLDKRGLRSIVLEHPSLLTEEERNELEKILGKDIYTIKTEYVKE